MTLYCHRFWLYQRELTNNNSWLNIVFLLFSFLLGYRFTVGFKINKLPCDGLTENGTFSNLFLMNKLDTAATYKHIDCVRQRKKKEGRKLMMMIKINCAQTIRPIVDRFVKLAGPCNRSPHMHFDINGNDKWKVNVNQKKKRKEKVVQIKLNIYYLLKGTSFDHFAFNVKYFFFLVFFSFEKKKWLYWRLE